MITYQPQNHSIHRSVEIKQICFKTGTELDLGLYLANIIIKDDYENAIIVDRRTGASEKIQKNKNNKSHSHWEEFKCMNIAFAYKTKMIANEIDNLLLSKDLCNLCLNYLQFKVESSSWSHIGTEENPMLFTAANTLLVIHGIWSVVHEGETLVANMKNRKNHCTIAKILDRSYFNKHQPDFSTIDILKGTSHKTQQQMNEEFKSFKQMYT